MNNKDEENKEIEEKVSEEIDEVIKDHSKSDLLETLSNDDKSADVNDELADEEHRSAEDMLKDELETLRDEKLRLLAEMENLRKRSDREKIDSIRYGSFNLARDILSPDDNLTRALNAIPKENEMNTVNNLVDGLKMVQKEFSTILEKHGIKKIDALNKKFDHNYHQAMVEVENNEVDEGTIIQEMQSGYVMHDRLLRPSMVGVSKKPQKT